MQRSCLCRKNQRKRTKQQQERKDNGFVSAFATIGHKKQTKRSPSAMSHIRETAEARESSRRTIVADKNDASCDSALVKRVLWNVNDVRMNCRMRALLQVTQGGSVCPRRSPYCTSTLEIFISILKEKQRKRTKKKAWTSARPSKFK